MSADRVLAAPYSAGLHDQNFESAQKILVVKAVEHDFYFASNSDVWMNWSLQEKKTHKCLHHHIFTFTYYRLWEQEPTCYAMLTRAYKDRKSCP